MTTRIFKYELVPRMDLLGMHPEVHVQMPDGAEIRHVDAQGERMFAWAVVDPEAPPRRYAFVVLPTGAEVTWPPDLLPLTWTVLMHGGALVWHVFTDGRPRGGGDG